MINKILYALLLFCLTTFQAHSGEVNNSFYGAWQYKVKVGHTSIFNPEYFTKSGFDIFGLEALGDPSKLDSSNIIGKKVFIGNKPITMIDNYYTGYFQLNPYMPNNIEVMGTYYPSKFARTDNRVKFNFLKSYKLDNGLIKILWKLDLKKKTIQQMPLVWLVEANYNPKTDTMNGLTIVLDCKNNPCTIANIAHWEGERIADINYYSHENYYNKGIIARILQIFDKKGSLAKNILKNEFDPQTDKFIPIQYFKPSIRAMLPTHAESSNEDDGSYALPVSEDYQLQLLCSRRATYCADTYPYWFGTNSVNKMTLCNTSVADISSLCCNNAGGVVPGCQCYIPYNCQTPNCMICCIATTVCKEKGTYTYNNGPYKDPNDTVETGDDKSIDYTDKLKLNGKLQGIRLARAVQSNTAIRNYIIKSYPNNVFPPYFYGINISSTDILWHEYVYSDGDISQKYNLPPYEKGNISSPVVGSAERLAPDVDLLPDHTSTNGKTNIIIPYINK